LSGSLHGGQSPVTGSTITLYAAGGGLAAATVLGTTTTDAAGGWSMSSYTCPSASAAAYVIASGGNPGLSAGTNNSALKLAAALGPCGNLPDFVNIDEVTTVAAAYALNGFIGPNGCVDCGGPVPIEVSNVHGKNPGLANAMGNAARLASVATGSASPPLPSAAACAASSPPANCVAEERLNSMANSLAACVNSSGPTSAQCVELFDCATPGATFSGGACTVPTGSSLAADTLTAALEIARNPGQVPAAGVYYVATRNAVFSPALGAEPTDWTLGLNMSGGGLNQPVYLAIDADGNAWVSNVEANSLSEFSPLGTPLTGGYPVTAFGDMGNLAIDASGNVWVLTFTTGGGNLSKFSAAGTLLFQSSGSTAGGLDAPAGIAIDAGGNVWISNATGNSLSEFDSAGTALTGSSGYTGGGLNDPLDLAIDASGNVWTANLLNNSLSEFNSSGTALSGSGGYTGGGLDSPYGLAVDPSGNLWIANFAGSRLSEFSDTGAALSGSGGYTKI
jgi:streptogramin lyase